MSVRHLGDRIVPPWKTVNCMFRRLRIVTILAAAVGVPYVASETEFGRESVTTITEAFSSVGGDADEILTSIRSTSGGPASYGNNAHHEVEKLRRQDPDRYRYEPELAAKLSGVSQDPNSAPSLVGARVQDLREVLRFDITPEWVIQRFSRVSTVLADLRLEGLRVPVVTGTKADDLAGTLTYYFDQSRNLQRVTIHGFTGDPNRLVNTMTEYYALSHEPTLEAGVYTRRWNGLPIHFLRLSHAPVVYSDAVHQKYTVFLELNQPNLAFGISEEAKRIVHNDRGTGRW